MQLARHQRVAKRLLHETGMDVLILARFYCAVGIVCPTTRIYRYKQFMAIFSAKQVKRVQSFVCLASFQAELAALGVKRRHIIARMDSLLNIEWCISQPAIHYQLTLCRQFPITGNTQKKKRSLCSSRMLHLNQSIA